MAEKDDRKLKQEGVIAKSFGVVAKTVFWLLISLLFSIAMEWIGMTIWWPDEGAAHSEQMIEKELQYLNDDFKRSVVTSDPARFALGFAAFANEWLFEKTGFRPFLEGLRGPPTPNENRLISWARTVYRQTANYVNAMMNTVETFSVRLAVLTLAMPTFFLAAMVALTEGLVRRDLRRWGGGRETSFVYHHAKRVILPLLITVWVVYLSMPVSVHPTLVVLPFAVLFAIAITITASTFKKYL